MTEKKSYHAGGGQRLGGGRRWELLFNGYKVLVLQDEKVLEIVCTKCKYT